MTEQFGATVVINRPIQEVFAFLAEGKEWFTAGLSDISKTTPGSPGAGTAYAGTVRYGWLKLSCEFRVTEFEPPTRIRWTELRKGRVVVSEGSYDLIPSGDGTQLTCSVVIEGRGLGVLVAWRAMRDARLYGVAHVQGIKAALEYP